MTSFKDKPFKLRALILKQRTMRVMEKKSFKNPIIKFHEKFANKTFDHILPRLVVKSHLFIDRMIELNLSSTIGKTENSNQFTTSRAGKQA